MKRLALAFYLALSFLTRLRLSTFEKKIHFPLPSAELRHSVIFYPLVGWILGGLNYLLAVGLRSWNVKGEFIALSILALSYFLTGFLHWDGLIDVSDAFFSNRSRDDRLKILKDPHVGSFALGIGTIYLLARFFLTKEFIEHAPLLPLLIAIPTFSRGAAVLLSAISSYPRTEGTGQFLIGKISLKLSLATIFSAGLLVAVTLGIFQNLEKIIIIAVFVVYLLGSHLAIRQLSISKIGGVTGDVLGCAIEISELGMLALACAFA